MAPTPERPAHVIERLRRSVDFERVLRTRSRASSAHFALHHGRAGKGELSTGVRFDDNSPVDDLSSDRPGAAVWLGAVVPKRHARRAATRNLMKRQIRAAADDRGAALAGGCWVVRLRAPFDKATYPSATSDALRRDVRAELQQLMDRAIGGRVPGR